MSTSEQFSRFKESLDKHTLYALIPILAVNFALDYLFALQPPWPKSSTYVTAFLEISTVFVAFFVSPLSKKRLVRWQVITFTFITFLFLSYFFLYSAFVFETPLDGTRVVGGFECTYEAREYVARVLNQNCPFLSEEALSFAQYDAEKVWTRLSIIEVEFALFVCWSLFFVASTFLAGISVAYLARRAKKT